MTLPLFIGSTLIAFGPVLSLSYFVVLQRSQLTILSLCSAWIFMITLIFSSVIWSIIVPIQNNYPLVMVLSVAFQELCRFGIIKVYYYCYETIVTRKRLGQDDSDNHSTNNSNIQILPINNISAAISIGTGIAAIYSFMLYGHVGSKTVSAGTFYLESCKSMSIYILHACFCCSLSLLHVMWTVLAFDSYNKRSMLRSSVVVVSHLVALLITLLNTSNEGCITSILSELALVILVGFYTFKIIQQGIA
jgi:gamma-secretase subunit APH-1